MVGRPRLDADLADLVMATPHFRPVSSLERLPAGGSNGGDSLIVPLSDLG
jgi:hypothetical protein